MKLWINPDESIGRINYMMQDIRFWISGWSSDFWTHRWAHASSSSPQSSVSSTLGNWQGFWAETSLGYSSINSVKRDADNFRLILECWLGSSILKATSPPALWNPQWPLAVLSGSCSLTSQLRPSRGNSGKFQGSSLSPCIPSDWILSAFCTYLISLEVQSTWCSLKTISSSKIGNCPRIMAPTLSFSTILRSRRTASYSFLESKAI